MVYGLQRCGCNPPSTFVFKYVPYRQISRIKKGVNVVPVASAAEKENELTLNDKVKYLEETMEDINPSDRIIRFGPRQVNFPSPNLGLLASLLSTALGSPSVALALPSVP